MLTSNHIFAPTKDLANLWLKAWNYEKIVKPADVPLATWGLRSLLRRPTGKQSISIIQDHARHLRSQQAQALKPNIRPMTSNPTWVLRTLLSVTFPPSRKSFKRPGHATMVWRPVWTPCWYLTEKCCNWNSVWTQNSKHSFQRQESCWHPSAGLLELLLTGNTSIHSHLQNQNKERNKEQQKVICLLNLWHVVALQLFQNWVSQGSSRFEAYPGTKARCLDSRLSNLHEAANVATEARPVKVKQQAATGNRLLRFCLLGKLTGWRPHMVLRTYSISARPDCLLLHKCQTIPADQDHFCLHCGLQGI